MDEEKLFIDGSHIKASANNHKCKDKVIEKAIRVYEEELQQEIIKDRELHGKNPLKEVEQEPQQVHQKESTTDPESCYFHK